MATVAELLGAMRQKVGFEAVQQRAEGGQIYLVGRIRGQTIGNILIFVHRLLLAAKTAPWNADASQNYMLKNGQLVKGWRIVIYTDDQASTLDQVLQVLRSSPAARQPQVDEIPLAGASPDRNAPNARGKGAALTGQAFIGRR